MQRNWIGRSEGCDIVFGLVGGEGSEFAAEEEEAAASLSASSSSSSSSSTRTLTAFTTRADTLFGVTYVVLAPEHPLALKLATPAQRAAVQAYITSAASKSDLERTAEKTGAAARSGVATGSFAVHPVTGAEVPVWVADYVLGSYGTGAVMAVPAHDSRDAEFARQHSLPVVEVVAAAEGEGDEKSSSPSTSTPTPIFTSDGVCVSSSGNGLDLNGLTSAEARAKVGAFLSSKNDEAASAAGRASRTSSGTGCLRGSATGASPSPSPTRPKTKRRTPRWRLTRPTCRWSCRRPTTSPPTAPRTRRWPR